MIVLFFRLWFIDYLVNYGNFNLLFALMWLMWYIKTNTKSNTYLNYYCFRITSNCNLEIYNLSILLGNGSNQSCFQRFVSLEWNWYTFFYIVPEFWVLFQNVSRSDQQFELDLVQTWSWIQHLFQTNYSTRVGGYWYILLLCRIYLVIPIILSKNLLNHLIISEITN